MKTVKLHNKNFDVYMYEQQIKLRVEQIAKEIFQSLNGKVPHFIAVLNGSFIFASDLLRAYPGDCKISFVKLSSYIGLESTGNVLELIGLKEVVDDEELVVLEDIVDTGTTLLKIDEILKAKGQSWQISSLFLKPDDYKGDRKIDYVGFERPNRFIVGYGLDYDGLGRNLKNVYQLAKA